MNLVLRLNAFAIIISFLFACNDDNNSTNVDSLNQLGYTIEKIEGSNLSKAYKIVDNSVVEEGFLKDNKQHGNWIEYFPGTQRIKDSKNFDSGALSGSWLKFNNLGRVETMEQYFNNMLHGRKIIYLNGIPMEYAEYKNNQLHGTFRMYYKNGTLQQEVAYTDGKINGFFRHFNEDGKLTVEYLYQHGEKIKGGIVE